MADTDFKFSMGIVWGLFSCNLCLVIIGAYMKVMHRPMANEIIVAAFAIELVIYLILISDLYNNKIQNKLFWVLSLFTFPGIAPLVYLMQRNRLLMR